MYEQYFGFSRRLFGDELARDEAVFVPEGQARLAKDLAIALSRRDAVAVLSGPSGTGKSTLAGNALHAMGTRLAFDCISHPPLTPHELLEQLLNDFGFEPYRLSRVERLQAWRQFLSEMTATDTRVCLLIESAEDIGVDVLKALHGLTVADAAQSPGANLILTSTQPVETLLAPSALEPLRQRLCLRRAIAPLSRSETRDYLAFKAAYAGGDSEFFDDELAETIHALTGGVVRVVNNLVDSSLMLAAASRDRKLTSELVRAAAAEHFGIEQAASAAAVDELLAESDTADDRSGPDDELPSAESPDVESPDVESPDVESPDVESPDGAERVGADFDPKDIPTLTDSVPPSGEPGDVLESDSIESGIDPDVDAIANARVLEDISSSMAETIFGNHDLDELMAGMAEQRSARR